ncbi:uncharacterized protein A4U43_C03F21680 [Asparagus officinalis]|uniref:Uncharacterized protein n=1 Tax=Asparagus officinalis TaxID=4686 RepID=A0A5P1FDS3_ASPOF|nr:metal transporter Nramp4-like [Asparagus officinalis]ONK75893.1 uncharacterized protein A4U43_C03F21680 [Asparagus officinalis]
MEEAVAFHGARVPDEHRVPRSGESGGRSAGGGANWARLVLWVMAEVALIGADIQEVIGSAIAIKILSGGVVPLWGGVVVTALDCFVFLFLENYGVRKLEAVFAILIATMAVSFAWMFGETKPNGKELLIGIFLLWTDPIVLIAY